MGQESRWKNFSLSIASNLVAAVLLAILGWTTHAGLRFLAVAAVILIVQVTFSWLLLRAKFHRDAVMLLGSFLGDEACVTWEERPDVCHWYVFHRGTGALHHIHNWIVGDAIKIRERRRHNVPRAVVEGFPRGKDIHTVEEYESIFGEKKTP
ncbi:MAG: hypothetical protein WBW48_03490 [Anaerolineae bacterium]